MGNSLQRRHTARPTLAGLTWRAARDPWTLLVGSFVGGLAWAAGGAPGGLSVLVGVAAVAAGAVSSVLFGNVGPAPKRELDADLRWGSPQAVLLGAFDAYLVDLTRLRESRLPQVVTDPAIEALMAAQDARTTAVRVAAVVDALDNALGRSQETHSRWGGGGRSTGIAQAEQRMATRREELLGSLDAAVGEVAEVYTKLLELSATAEAEAAGLGSGGAVSEVNDSLDSLRSALGALELSAPDELAGPDAR